MYVEYAIFDNTGHPIFAAWYPNVQEAMRVVANALDDASQGYAGLFPVTIKGLTRSDIYVTIITITSDSEAS